MAVAIDPYKNMLTNVAMKEAYDEVKVLHNKAKLRAAATQASARPSPGPRPWIPAEKDKEPPAPGTHGGLKPPTPKRT